MSEVHEETTADTGRRVAALRESYSQFGEDQALVALLETHRRLEPGTYVDVGCFDPWVYTNTGLLYRRYGWSGVLIDANAAAIESCRSERPRDVAVQALVGHGDQERTYFTFDHPAVNTADGAMLAQQTGEASPFVLLSEETMAVQRLDTLLDAHLAHDTTIGVMSVDVEGMDLEVLETNDWQRYRPFLLCVEAHGFVPGDPDRHPIHRMMTGMGYDLVAHHFVTSIYRDLTALP